MTEYARRPLFRRGSGHSSTYWRGIPGIPAEGVPATALLTEDDDPLLTELGEYLVTET